MDVFLGIDDPTQDAWEAWHREMLAERARAAIDESIYDDPASAWSDTAFRQLFLFLYDASFRPYRTAELLDEAFAKFGRVDEVLLWHAYPRLGFDSRTQFDFYRQLPGGLSRVRAEVSDVLHARGVRVAIDYNPWDAGSHDELAEIVAALDADAVMLDTMPSVPGDLARAIARRKPGVVLEPELRLRDEDLACARRSWAQWLEIPEGPSIYRNRWLVPRHRQLAIARWDASRRRDIVYAFFNGSGLVLWENVFGSYNPYSREDRRLVAETGAVLERYGELFARGEWLPLVPTGVSGLDANRFVDRETGRSITTFRNRTDRALEVPMPHDACFVFWGDRARVVVEPRGTQALVRDDEAHARDALAHFDALSARALALPEELPRPMPKRRSPPRTTRTSTSPMIALPGGSFTMRIRHERRECGCWDHPWGSPYQETIAHEVQVELAPFSIRATAVTNAEYLAFVRASGYTPRDPERFLLGARDDAFPVTHVSLEDARAFAAFHGERLPTEAEWQWAAEDAGDGRRFPWGDAPRAFLPHLRAAADAATATSRGVMGLSGNAWELTESEWDDGHTRFVMLRGGVYLPPGESEWLVARGPRPNDSHAKYILLADGLDRSEAISFRTVRP